jgi:flagella basal body P-ring formation protein FlgA
LKRGDSVQIVYRAPGIELIAGGKASADASVGGRARALNLRSNKPVDGILVSPGRIEAFSVAASPATQVASLDGAN